jgi:hypothetical protein
MPSCCEGMRFHNTLQGFPRFLISGLPLSEKKRKKKKTEKEEGQILKTVEK